MYNIATECGGCGSTNISFDRERRMVTCNQCGKVQTYSRANLNTSGKVVFGKENAMKFFLEGKYEAAYHYALDVLNISIDNAPSLYVIAFYEEYVMNKDNALDKFFKKIIDIELDFLEIEELRNLFIASAYRLLEYEEEVIVLLTKNMQAEEDKKDLVAFLDKFCPYLISKRTSSDFLTNELKEMYKELVSYCGIPKTCFALLKSIDTNPDSPYVTNAFYLKSKTQYFFDHYVLVIGEIINEMKEGDFKAKFTNAFNQKKQKLEEDMNS